MKSTMHQFNRVPDVRLPRSKFNRSHGLKTTFGTDFLYPIYTDEYLPGDTFNLKMTAFARLSTPLKPIMDNLFLDTFFFAVPNRLVWANFQKFCGEQDNPDDDVTAYIMPKIIASGSTGFTEGSLSDYLGLPTKVNSLTVSALWHRAYNLIWNTWFRDQNLQDSVVVDTDDATSDIADYVLLKRNKRHDYFTSCLPSPQKGDAVQMPLGSTADIIGTNTDILMHNNNDEDRTLYGTSGSATISFAEGNLSNSGALRWGLHDDYSITGLKADLATATAATINSLRQAFQIQKLLERDMRSGTRYRELVRSHFLVESTDQRHMVPIYLGGNSQRINVSAIPQQSATGATGTPQGNLAAMGTVSMQAGFTQSFTEHGIIIGLANIRADLTYQAGVNRAFSRNTRYDFYWPSFANLGEQVVYNKEINALNDLDPVTGDDGPFGYQERGAEYRYHPSIITGLFRSNATGSIDIWHLAQDFGGTTPVLGSDFIEENVPISRIMAVPAEPPIIFDSYFELICARPMPVYSIPGMIDHL